MAATAADVLVDTLQQWNVEVVFGLPGDGIHGIMEALRTRQDRIRFVQVRQEEAAAFMACGYAKFTGRLGVCLATSGPGDIHLLNGLYDAGLDGQPALAITDRADGAGRQGGRADLTQSPGGLHCGREEISQAEVQPGREQGRRERDAPPEAWQLEERKRRPGRQG